MKKIFYVINTFLFLSIFLHGASAMAQNIVIGDIEPVRIGDLEIFPIKDADVTMERSILPELDKYPTYNGAFSNGPLPAVDQVFLFQKDNHLVLIDSGWGEEGKIKGETLKTLQNNNIQPEQITDILLTHLDYDHIGGLLKNGEKVFPNANLWIAKPEYEAWKTGNLPKRSNENIKLANNMLNKYSDKIVLFDFDEEIFPGIRAINASGHTPGHTAFDITSGQDKLTVAGDLLHIWQVQLDIPELSSIYDNDPELAAKSRINLLNRAVEEKAIFSGMHFPLISPVIKKDNNGFLMRAPR